MSDSFWADAFHAWLVSANIWLNRAAEWVNSAAIFLAVVAIGTLAQCVYQQRLVKEEKAALLEIYEGRKLNDKGERPRFWIGLRPHPGDLPTRAQIDAAVANMRAEHKDIVTVDRPDDGSRPAHLIEDHHVTFVAMIQDAEDGFETVKRLVNNAGFRRTDLRPSRYRDGALVLRSLRKGNTVFLVQEFEESERLKRARIRAARDYCQMYDETTRRGYIVHDAHVTLAYGNLPKPAPNAAASATAAAVADSK